MRCAAHGRSLARSSRLLEAQARLVTNTRSRLAVARRMYGMRFEGEDVDGLTMHQLRGREGARVRRIYRDLARDTGIEWSRRDYRVEDFASGDRVNQALSAAKTSLYGLVHAAVVALGCSPGLGFVHTGHELSFVFDIADLYKAEVSIPAAFEVAAGDSEDVPAEARRAVRDRLWDGKLLERRVRDVRSLLSTGENEPADGLPDADVVFSWDDRADPVAGRSGYGVDF